MSVLSVTGLDLSHFRSYRALRLSLDGRPVAVFGPNGAGKTNLIEAVSLLSPGRGLRRAAADELTRRPEHLGWRIGATIRTDGAEHEIDLRAEAGGRRELRLDGKAAPQLALGRLVPMLWLVPAMDRLWIEAAEGRRRFLDRLTLSFAPDHAEAVLTYEKAMRQRNRLLKDAVQDPRWFAALEHQMAEAGAQIVANREAAIGRIARAQTEAETAFPAALLSIATEAPRDAPGLADALAEGRARDMAAGRSLTGPHRDDLDAVYLAKGMPAAQCSTGEQKALLISLVLAATRALAAEGGAPPIVLLDEVAAHLDPARRAVLYDEVCALGAQAWMTGTDSGLFAGLHGRAQALEVTEADGASVVREVAL